jgi:hypothetical protein
MKVPSHVAPLVVHAAGAEARLASASRAGERSLLLVFYSGHAGSDGLEFGSERDTRSLMQALLGRPVSPEALLRQVRRCRD